MIVVALSFSFMDFFLDFLNFMDFLNLHRKISRNKPEKHNRLICSYVENLETEVLGMVTLMDADGLWDTGFGCFRRKER